LAEWLNVSGASHIERGKKVQAALRNGVDALRPSGERPEEPLPRDWYNYAILYDAYIKGVANNEVMARLYISEGTFHRTRRNAVRGVTRWLIEKKIKHHFFKIYDQCTVTSKKGYVKIRQNLQRRIV
jgi:hypothetical protein